MKLETVKGNLFNVTPDFVLAHCISRDAAMGAGIAKQFRNKYPKMPLYVMQRENTKFNPLVVYRGKDNRIIANLVTKSKYWQKPSYASVKKSLLELCKYMTENNLKKLAMPKIAVGLDRLSWEDTEVNGVKSIINEIFEPTNIRVVIVEYK